MLCLGYTAWGRRVGIALLLGLDIVLANGSRSGQDAASLNAAISPAASATPEVCESRTVNYITHTLPQQCLRTAWTSAAPTNGPREGITSPRTDAPTVTSTVAVPEVTSSTEPQAPAQGEAPSNQRQRQDDTDSEDLSTTTFMSFEEWKEMMLRKSGDPANIKARKQQEQRESKGERDAAGIANGDLDSLGDDAEISLDFDALSEKVSEITAPSSGGPAVQTPETPKEEQVLYDDGKTQYYRSKDAGKTCKERFSYSSFDAGATILKTNPGAKNAKAILVENKDSYMLLECRSKNKFVVVELSDDILVDTIVLANFEFFSSMIRKFRVSVSDRYPGKWLDLGTFEARNSRDIQPFLVEHPQIYTKYLRIEFLTHYGNEYYCPVSLLRVHGTRMLDTWKDNGQDDEPEQIEAPAQEVEQIEPPHEDNSTEGVSEPPKPPNVTQETMTESPVVPVVEWSPWDPMMYSNLTFETCVLRSPTTGEPTPVSSGVDGNNSSPAGQSEVSHAAESTPETAAQEKAQPTGSSSANGSQESSSARAHPTDSSSSSGSSESPSSQPSHASSNSPSQKPSIVRVETAETPQNPPSAKAGKANSTTPTTPRHKTSAASSASPSPTVQESFFKSVTKRLQVLESNTTLSLQYIEDQSRFLQEVLTNIEKKQINRVDSFLNTLNKTVLAELRYIRTQYDQIWQSTVIALETQREQSQREIVALTSRVNILAEEVVFQKRMSIAQSIILLICLALFIFSNLGGPSLSIANTYTNMMSPSPPPPRRGGGGFVVHDFNSSPSPPTQRSNISSGRYYYSDKALPLTPASPDFIVMNRTRENGGAASAPMIRVDPASPEYIGVEDDHDHGRDRQELDLVLEDSILMTPPSSRAISEEPLVPIPKPIPAHTSIPTEAAETDQIQRDKKETSTPNINTTEEESPSTPDSSLSSLLQHPDADTDTGKDQDEEETSQTDMTTSTPMITTTPKNNTNHTKKKKKETNNNNHDRIEPGAQPHQQPVPAPVSIKRGGGAKVGAGAGIGGRKPLPALPEDPS